MITRATLIAYSLGILGLLAITFPFLWFTLIHNFQAGTVLIQWTPSHAFVFFGDLLPVVLAAVVGYWLIWLVNWAQLPALCQQGLDRVISMAPAGLKLRQNSANWLGGVICPILMLAPFVLSSSALGELSATCLWMLLAVGLNITVGMTGLLVLGYAGFYSFGAYFFAVMQEHVHFFTWWMALPITFVLGAVMGLMLGLPCLRLRGDYLAIVTLGFAEAFRELTLNLDLTHTDQGISLADSVTFTRIPYTHLNAGATAYWVTLLILIATVIVVQRLRASPIGRAWVAIRENEIAAASMGIPVVPLKLLAFSLSAAIAAAAGVIYDARETFISPVLGLFQNSIMVLAMVILGGLGNTYGAMLGAAILYLVPEFMKLLPTLISNSRYHSYVPQSVLDALNNLEDYRLFIFGIVMVAVMLNRPQGLLGSPRRSVEMKEAA